MPKNEGLVGIGVALNVNAETRAFRNMMTDLQRAGVDVVDEESVHITVVDSRETQFPIRSPRDELALDNARDAVGRYLSGLALGLRRLTPESRRVGSFGFRRSRVGLFIAEQLWLEEIRDEIGEIFYDKAKVGISSGRPYIGHITVGSKRRGSGHTGSRRSSRRMSSVRIPGVIHLNGFSITEKTGRRQEDFPRRVQRSKYDRSYRNVPANVRQS